MQTSRSEVYGLQSAHRSAGALVDQSEERGSRSSEVLAGPKKAFAFSSGKNALIQPRKRELH